MKMKFYECDMPTPPMLLRISESGAHELFANSRWQPTELLSEYFSGQRHDIDPITEELARQRYPLAFV